MNQKKYLFYKQLYALCPILLLLSNPANKKTTMKLFRIILNLGFDSESGMQNSIYSVPFHAESQSIFCNR